MHTIDLVYLEAGGGHRAAARAIEAVASQQHRRWNLRPVDLGRLLDPDDRVKRLIGMRGADLYNLRLRKGWTFGMAQELKLLQASIRMLHRPIVRLIERHWQGLPAPDLVVSLIPNFNRALHEGVRRGAPGARFATVLTDLADVPGHFWIEPGLDQTVVCGSTKAVEQAVQAGYPHSRIVQTSGMPLNPSFYTPATTPVAQARAELGLQPERPTGVVSFGGQGATPMLRIAAMMPDMQFVFLCGHNESLRQQLRAITRRAPHAALGFTNEMPSALRLGDFFVGKPGPGSLSEAVHLGLPVVTWLNRATMPQERYNARWVLENGVGLVVNSPADLPQAVRELASRLPAFRAAARNVDNRAIFEIADALEAMISEPRDGVTSMGRRSASVMSLAA